MLYTLTIFQKLYFGNISFFAEMLYKKMKIKSNKTIVSFSSGTQLAYTLLL